MAMAWCCASGASAHAVEMRGELAIGREFVYATSGVEAEVLDGQLGLGAGLTMISDYAIERYGVHALIEYRGAHVTAGVAATFGPRQERRGWASIDPHAELQLQRRSWDVRVGGGVLLRRIDVAAPRRSFTMDQLQLHGSVDATIADRWRIGVFGVYSFYDPSPAASALHDVDLGLAVTLAGRPEHWAVGGHAARRVARPLWLEVGLAGVAYASGSGHAVVPRAGVGLGPWAGVSVGLSADVVVDADPTAEERVRVVGGLELGYEP
jgi:hypothetical protein